MLTQKVLFDFNTMVLGSLIGQGAQGRIIAAKEDGQMFAVKILKKRHLIEHKLTDHIYNELVVLHMINHPNIVKFYGYSQDDYHLYYKLELIKGLDLYRYIQVTKPLTTGHCLFYTVQIINVLDYLHQRNIIYRQYQVEYSCRDLKPENIMINQKGYLQLSDFGLSKIADNSGRTYTCCGTQEYMAPEVIQSKNGYTRAIDFWGLGILIYEMVTGIPPFPLVGDPYAQCQKILYDDVRFPKSFDKNLKKLVNQLLIKDPIKRMQPFAGQISKVLQNDVFIKIQISNICDQSLEAPLLPETASDENYMVVDQKLTRQLTEEKLKREEDVFLDF